MSKKRCKAKWSNGKRCNSQTTERSIYCAIHQKKQDEQRKKRNTEFNRILTLHPPTFLGKKTVERYDYHKYLQSDEWKRKAEKAKRENPNCVLCNRKKGLHVHHRTYVRCGSEGRHDLVVLCGDCHKLFHDNYEYSQAGYFIKK